jgi:hypothetical protein
VTWKLNVRIVEEVYAVIAGQHGGKHMLIATDKHATTEKHFMCSLYKAI